MAFLTESAFRTTHSTATSPPVQGTRNPSYLAISVLCRNCAVIRAAPVHMRTLSLSSSDLAQAGPTLSTYADHPNLRASSGNPRTSHRNATLNRSFTLPEEDMAVVTLHATRYVVCPQTPLNPSGSPAPFV